MKGDATIFAQRSQHAASSGSSLSLPLYFSFTPESPPVSFSLLVSLAVSDLLALFSVRVVHLLLCL